MITFSGVSSYSFMLVFSVLLDSVFYWIGLLLLLF